MADRPPAEAERPTLDSVGLRRLRWRARRGLLENDLLIGRFLDRFGTSLDAAQNRTLLKLLELPDNELLDLLLARSEPGTPLDTADVQSLLAIMRSA